MPAEPSACQAQQFSIRFRKSASASACKRAGGMRVRKIRYARHCVQPAICANADEMSENIGQAESSEPQQVYTRLCARGCYAEEEERHATHVLPLS